jgi:hypothetical protein
VASVLIWLLLVANASSQETEEAFDDVPKPIRFGSLSLSGELRGRGQGWNWFSGDERVKYGFGDSLLRLSLSQERSKLDWKIEVAQPALYNLPADAVATGGVPLGLGGIYFSANGKHRNPASVFVKQAYISLRGIDGNGGVLQLGRFEFSDGLEKIPEASDLAWIKQQRIAHRLIGDSYWTDIGRSLDGIHFFDNFGDRNNVTFVAARATRGVWQTDGSGEMDVDILYGAFTREFATTSTASELHVFGLGYHDGRGLLKTDNRPLSVRVADTQNIRIGTFGVSYAIAAPIRYTGKWDLMAWGAEQIGRWGVLNHRANSGTVEIGWRPPIPWVHPWIRAGAFFASGDGNPNDSQHTTFFQPLPTEQLYARLPFYTLQNTEDYMGQVIVKPTRKLEVRSEVHKVKLHAVNDLWYLGSGAFQNTSFGYIGLPNNGHRGLGNYVDFNADYRLSSRWFVRGYIGALSGKGAITDQTRGRKGGFAYLDVVYRF